MDAGGATEKEESFCPTCGADIPQDAAECPECGEQLDPQPEAEIEEARQGTTLFWIGLVLVLIGGPGIALGSWLHDLLRIPILGEAYDVFGWLNQLFAAAGLIVLVVGMVVLIWSMAREAYSRE
ncbi:MAG: zinc-ribbon domain-containing protein [Candidatus Thermoplasmatota archaeon]